MLFCFERKDVISIDYVTKIRRITSTAFNLFVIITGLHCLHFVLRHQMAAIILPTSNWCSSSESGQKTSCHLPSIALKHVLVLPERIMLCPRPEVGFWIKAHLLRVIGRFALHGKRRCLHLLQFLSELPRLMVGDKSEAVIVAVILVQCVPSCHFYSLRLSCSGFLHVSEFSRCGGLDFSVIKAFCLVILRCDDSALASLHGRIVQLLFCLDGAAACQQIGHCRKGQKTL